jgi:hypothetical protein
MRVIVCEVRRGPQRRIRQKSSWWRDCEQQFKRLVLIGRPEQSGLFLFQLLSPAFTQDSNGLAPHCHRPFHDDPQTVKVFEHGYYRLWLSANLGQVGGVSGK